MDPESVLYSKNHCIYTLLYGVKSKHQILVIYLEQLLSATFQSVIEHQMKSITKLVADSVSYK